MLYLIKHLKILLLILFHLAFPGISVPLQDRSAVLDLFLASVLYLIKHLKILLLILFRLALPGVFAPLRGEPALPGVSVPLRDGSAVLDLFLSSVLYLIKHLQILLLILFHLALPGVFAPFRDEPVLPGVSVPPRNKPALPDVSAPLRGEPVLPGVSVLLRVEQLRLPFFFLLMQLLATSPTLVQAYRQPHY